MEARARRWLAFSVALGLSIAGTLGVWLVGAPAAGVSTTKLPDLDQLVPTEVSVTAVPSTEPRFSLAFDSRIGNGRAASVGPLIVSGRRSGLSEPMVAEQALMNANGSETIRPAIGGLTYETSIDHAHWHYDDFDRYQLRRASDMSLVRPDNKTGFCMPDHLFTPDYCGSSNPNALEVREGLGRGYVDLYKANVEGQNIDVTGVPAGTYYLVHWANRDSSLCESNILNNVSATKLRLWPRGYGRAPYFRALEEVDTLPPPERQPRPSNCPLERKKPKVRVQFPRRQNVKRNKGIVAYARCSESCGVATTGRARVGGRAQKLIASQALGGKGRRIKALLPTTSASQRAILRSLRKGRPVSVKLTIRVRDRAGNDARPVRRTVIVLP
ncbi:MAG: hypothetical protein H0U84_09990 [Thermoleophilaceae bacterium]|nr:hypothetical protein [Thermoleophilaceae bacterium]